MIDYKVKRGRNPKDLVVRSENLNTRVSHSQKVKIHKFTLAMREIGHKGFTQSDALNYILDRHIDKMILEIKNTNKLFTAGES